MSDTKPKLSQLAPTNDPDDGLSAAAIAAIESSATNHLEFFKAILSQFKRIIHGDDAGDWKDDPASVFAGDASLKSLFSNSLLNHDDLDTLVHNIAEDSFDEIVRSAGKISQVTTFTDASKTTKIRDVVITRTAGFISKLEEIQFDALGVEIARITENISRGGFGNKVLSISRVKT